MNLRIFCTSLILLLSFSFPIQAEILPSFDLKYSAWHATDIVVATEGPRIDGILEVMECWRGSLRAGDKITIQEIADFAPDHTRKVMPPFGGPRAGPLDVVTGKRIILFLIRSNDQENRWSPATFFKDMRVSVSWIEKGNAYGFLQMKNPGPTLLVDLGNTEQELRRDVQKISSVKADLTKAIGVPDLELRAKSLRKFTASDNWFARKESFAAIATCGENSMQVLREILKDEKLSRHHPDALDTMVRAVGTKAAPELTDIVRTELKFWRSTAPGLKVGWWNEYGVNSREKTDRLRTRYSLVLHALWGLKGLNYGECRPVVTEFRDFWRSLPQLEDRSGLNQMSEACDDVLKSLN